MTRRRAAMTLVELLVVIGLIATLLGLVLVGLRSGQAATPVQAARDFASVLLAAQSRALGKPEGAAVVVEAAADGRTGTTVHEARSLPLIVATCTGIPPATPSATTASVTISADVTDGYKVRFQAVGSGTGAVDVSPWYRFQAPGTVSFRSGAGQTADNTVWPKAQQVSLQALVARRPMPGATPIAVASQVAIDLRHSGVGDDPAALRGYGRFEGLGPVGIVYDQMGRVVDVMQRADGSGTPAEPLVPTQPIYFLFVVRDDIVSNRNTLASDKSVWVAIHPLSGRVTVAANVPQTAETSAALSAARANVRQGMISR